jgi:pantoate--beta-alanine ligase
MRVFYQIAPLREHLRQQRMAGKSVGFVPTMGALHAGHASLIKTSCQANDLTVCSIFVNPIQFNNSEDLAKYPRTLETDSILLQAAGCDVVFVPTAEEIYPESPLLKFDFGDLERVMEGQFRPGHFNGVGIVVSKLFNIVQPDRTYFGQKDLQQVAVVRRMMIDLGFQIELHPCPTLREADGLAMSSRNRNLLPEHRPIAALIFSTLTTAKEKILAGETIETIKTFVSQVFSTAPPFNLEYFEISNTYTLQPVTVQQPEGQNALCIAAFLGKVRLIDNFVF